MARPRFDTADPALRSAVLSAARGEFASKGYDGASLNKILVEAGLSKGAFYYYFDDKADLAGTLLEEIARASLDDLRAIKPPQDADGFWRELEATQERALDRMRQIPGEFELAAKLGQAVLENAEVAKRVMPLIGEAQTLWTGLFEAGQRLGVVRTDLPVHVVLALTMSVKSTLLKTLAPPGAPLDAQTFTRIKELQWDQTRRLLAPQTKAPS